MEILRHLLDLLAMPCHRWAMRANYKMQRLYIDADLVKGVSIRLEGSQAHYLMHVLRMKEGQEVLLFNGRDGEWRAQLTALAKKTVDLAVVAQEREQTPLPDLIYCFAPLKHARLDYMIQKAVEMGAGQLQPVITRHTQVAKLNLERCQANVIEAAEQCGVLSISQCHAPVSLDTLLAQWDETRPLIFCDEAVEGHNPLTLLQKMKRGRCGVLIGPEGGFSDEERQTLKSHSFVHAIPLGPRILRADTAAVAALAIIGATLGDWQ